MRRRRFSLLEVIIAIVVLTGIIAILMVASATMMDSWERVQNHSRSLDDTLALDRTLDNLLCNIVPFTWPDPEDNNREKQVFEGGSDYMVAAYLHSFNRLEDGALRFCMLTVEQNSLVAYYAPRPPFPQDLGAEKLRRSVLADEVDRISFEYVDQEEEEPVLVTDWEGRNYLPLGILLHIEFTDGTYEDWFRRTAGSGYYERWGEWDRNASKDQLSGARR